MIVELLKDKKLLPQVGAGCTLNVRRGRAGTGLGSAWHATHLAPCTLEVVTAGKRLFSEPSIHVPPAAPCLQLRHEVDDLVMPQDESLRTEATAIAQVGGSQDGRVWTILPA